MTTTLATRQDEQPLILPTKREALLKKIDSFKVNNMSARDKANYDELSYDMNQIFTLLCWSKLGITREQLTALDTQELDELAALIYEKSKVFGLIQTGILVCIPVVGWVVLASTTSCLIRGREETPLCKNMRYFWWYRRLKNRYHKKFIPLLASKKGE